MLDKTDELSAECPDGFADEEMSVLIVIKRDEPHDVFMKSYRRLFSSLNRYAKPTDADTNIIMDEDDVFAILTRRLVSEHQFFRWTGQRDKDSPRVKTQGKNLKSGETYFTSLQTLYEMNERLLSAAWRLNIGWGNGGEKQLDTKAFKTLRPDEEYIDGLFSELCLYWDALIAAIPSLSNEPGRSRLHELDSPTDGDGDSLLFWPLGQSLVADVARRLLDTAPMPDAPTFGSASAALRPLGWLDWDLHAIPWRDLLLVKSDDRWKMRSEERKDAADCAKRMLRWFLGLDEYNVDEIEALKTEWRQLLLPGPSDEEFQVRWARVESVRQEVSVRSST